LDECSSEMAHDHLVWLLLLHDDDGSSRFVFSPPRTLAIVKGSDHT